MELHHNSILKLSHQAKKYPVKVRAQLMDKNWKFTVYTFIKRFNFQFPTYCEWQISQALSISKRWRFCVSSQLRIVRYWVDHVVRIVPLTCAAEVPLPEHEVHTAPGIHSAHEGLLDVAQAQVLQLQHTTKPHLRTRYTFIARAGKSDHNSFENVFSHAFLHSFSTVSASLLASPPK